MAGQIIAIGGGGFGRNPKEPIIEDYIVNTASCKKPKVTFPQSADQKIKRKKKTLPEHGSNS